MGLEYISKRHVDPGLVRPPEFFGPSMKDKQPPLKIGGIEKRRDLI
jgi:hypothetical protein